jgi:O-acetyl-ADP-ribose deacetylase (regulator of RNase III)
MTVKTSLESIEADITTLALDAIVNAANEPLIMGGGVDGAIRRKAGPQMERDLRRIGRCPTGTAVITNGYFLPAKFVIHTVAPIWSGEGGAAEQERLLMACYTNALELADEHTIRSIAYPCIGTGIYGWPAERAAKLAFTAVTNHIEQGGAQSRIVFCCIARTDRDRYVALIKERERQAL